jgi:hypothetical protein
MAKISYHRIAIAGSVCVRDREEAVYIRRGRVPSCFSLRAHFI